jgi:photosystem II stability/assembly factor-like uncharacterized protein
VEVAMMRRDGTHRGNGRAGILGLAAKHLPALIAVPLLVAGPRLAPAGEWVELGPEGGDVRVIAIAPSDSSVVYAGTGGNGAFVSRDGGTNWRAARRGMGRTVVQALAVHPRDAQCVVAGTQDGRVLVSHDGGSSWGGAAALPAGVAVDALAFDDADAPTLFACAGPTVFRTGDLGRSWSASTPGAPPSPDALALALATNPRRPAEVWAGTSWGLFKSVDGGETWHEQTSDGVALSPAGAVAIDPTASDTVYAGSYCNWCYGPSAFPTYLVMRSEDGGRSWEALTSVPEPVLAVSVDPTDPASVVIATGTWISLTRDGGATWVGADSLPSAAVHGLVRDPSDAVRLLAAGDSGVAASPDGGVHWAASNSGLAAATVPVLAVAGRERPVVLAGIGAEGVTAYDPAAHTWAPSGDGLLPAAGVSCCPGITGIVPDPTTPETVYAAGSYTGVFKSVDGGEHWVPARTGLEQGSRSPGNFWTPVLAIDPRSPTTLYAGTEVGVFKTVDGAMSWSRVSLSLWPDCLALAVDPFDASNLVCGSHGILRSDDGGPHWESTPGAPATAWFRNVTADLHRDGRFYASAPGAGLYRSDDHANTWTQLPLPSGVGCYAYAGSDTTVCPYLGFLAVDPTTSGSVYIGTSNGVWRSLDDGESWSRVGSELANVSVASIAFDRSSGTIYAGTFGAGLLDWAPARPRRHLRTFGDSAVLHGPVLPLR